MRILMTNNYKEYKEGETYDLPDNIADNIQDLRRGEIAPEKRTARRTGRQIESSQTVEASADASQSAPVESDSSQAAGVPPQ